MSETNSKRGAIHVTAGEDDEEGAGGDADADADDDENEDAANLAELGRRVQAKALSPEDRWGLQNDFYALVKSGEASLVEYLDFLSAYRHEAAYLPLVSIADNLFT